LEQIDLTRGIVMIAYPGFHGLGDWEPIWIILENKEETDAKMDLTDCLEAEKTTLWAVNKELQRGKTFADMFGSNEKTKMVLKATMKGQGAPQREPMID
jgi:cilia- and flagella-associated protein 298